MKGRKGAVCSVKRRVFKCILDSIVCFFFWKKTWSGSAVGLFGFITAFGVGHHVFFLACFLVVILSSFRIQL